MADADTQDQLDALAQRLTLAEAAVAWAVEQLNVIYSVLDEDDVAEGLEAPS